MISRKNDNFKVCLEDKNVKLIDDSQSEEYPLQHLGINNCWDAVMMIDEATGLSRTSEDAAIRVLKAVRLLYNR